MCFIKNKDRLHALDSIDKPDTDQNLRVRMDKNTHTQIMDQKSTVTVIKVATCYRHYYYLQRC